MDDCIRVRHERRLSLKAVIQKKSRDDRFVGANGRPDRSRTMAVFDAAVLRTGRSKRSPRCHSTTPP